MRGRSRNGRANKSSETRKTTEQHSEARRDIVRSRSRSRGQKRVLYQVPASICYQPETFTSLCIQTIRSVRPRSGITSVVMDRHGRTCNQPDASREEDVSGTVECAFLAINPSEDLINGIGWQDQEDNQIKATEKAMQITATSTQLSARNRRRCRSRLEMQGP